jgi:16S rRNA (cytosine967-C5)-methyltransferase
LQTRVFKESIPDWLDKMGEEELGERWPEEIAALNQQAPVVLRANTLKTDVQKLKAKLEIEGVETTELPGYNNALQLVERKNIFTTDSFQEGNFEVQDASSQLVAEFLDVKPGMRVIDACAGAGGKTLHIASMMQNKGQIVAMDIYSGKLKELKKRAKRNGAHNIEPREITSSKVIKRMVASADRLLLDAPCSGLGVLKRNPDAKWKLQPGFIDEIKVIQQNILQDYNKMLKVGGIMVYATCSILPSENEKQVQTFLKGNSNFELIEEKTISPSKSGYDGFYMAKLKKIS